MALIGSAEISNHIPKKELLIFVHKAKHWYMRAVELRLIPFQLSQLTDSEDAPDAKLLYNPSANRISPPSQRHHPHSP